MSYEEAFKHIIGNELSNKEKRKLEIIEATIDCLAEDGLNQFSFNAIGKRLGIERSLVAHYFPKKNELLVAVIQYVYAIGQMQTAKLVEQERDPKKKILSIYIAAQQWIDSDPRFRSIVTLFYYLATSQNEFRELHTKIQSIGVERLRTLVEIHFKGSQRKSEIDKITLCLHSLMLGLTLKRNTAEGSSPQKDLSLIKYEIQQKLK